MSSLHWEHIIVGLLCLVLALVMAAMVDKET